MKLGILGFEVADLAAWEGFATRILGLTAHRRDDGALALRMDEQAERFLLTQGPADDLAFISWEVEPAELEPLLGRLAAAGVPVTDGDPATRGVERLFRFEDPAGIPTELFTGPARAPFEPTVVRGGFVTGAQGLGHVVLRARDREQSLDFYTRVLGFRLSDRIVTEVYGHKADITFLHANTRHHSLALNERQEKRLHHFLLEAREMDDVGLGYDRALRAGVPIVLTPGRHPNDRMFSFYARTPSGFEFELGWGGRQVDDATWEPTTYDRVSAWGHHPPALLQKVFRKQMEPQ